MAAFKKPLWFIVKFKSHCATGNTYDMLDVSNWMAQADGTIREIISKLNFPKPVAPTASSKDDPLFSKKSIKYISWPVSYIIKYKN